MLSNRPKVGYLLKLAAWDLLTAAVKCTPELGYLGGAAGVPWMG